ncbi:MAG: N-acetylglucosamine-6-phosphate deacetylase [Dehalococcoidia bacterium]|nr:N-acetylglucosamine-6-phosphate deacetylase [Chloroflexi bacterium CFX7]MCK6565960.1 N-acetylglucosamine-6-phosphate deacetylase [Dehalococcoidia bacterium]NUQ54503.1 N-acetylglucosamine-6-phosphate deacetylase [Dehalococcoidia bacterium]
MTARLLIQSGTVVSPGGPGRWDIEVFEGRIAAIGSTLAADGAGGLDASGLWVLPGFIDVHVHGGGGHSFFTSDAAAIRGYRQWVTRNGVTSFLVSTGGRDPGQIAARLEGLGTGLEGGSGAEPLGFHLEGPFLNAARRGAFDAKSLRAPLAAEFERWQEAAGGRIRQMTIAPELPGALEVIGRAAAAGVVPAMGHTDATAAEARAGFAAGIRHVTHLFNAMRPLHQREGGAIAAALLEPQVSCELICDGAHVAPEMLRLAFELLGPERTIVVTDNLSLAGTDEVSARFASGGVAVDGAVAKRPDGTIAGSVATMDAHFRNVMAFLGVDAMTASVMCSATPARLAGARERKGRIEPGYDADLVLLDSEWRVVATICRGQVAFCADPGRLSPGL